MTLSMSDIEMERMHREKKEGVDRRAMSRQNRGIYYLKLSRNDVMATAFCAVFGCIYESFSFGVYSYFMIYSFLIPLILGGIPFLLLGLRFLGGTESAGLDKKPGNGGASQLSASVLTASRLWHAGIATLTVGFLFKGVLSIYGTTSGLTKVYWIIGGMLLVAGLAFSGGKSLIGTE